MIAAPPGPAHPPGTYVVDVRGGAHGVRGGSDPTWMPRGHRLCMYTDKGPAIFSGTGRLRRRFQGSCAFSPNERWTIAPRQDSLTIQRVRDGKERRLVRGRYAYEWSPDSRRLYYVRDDVDEVWAADVDGGGRHQVLTGVGTFHGLSPDGRWILYNPPGRPEDYWVAPSRGAVHGHDARFLFHVKASARTVDWAPQDRGVFSIGAFGGRLFVHRLSGERRRPGFRIHGFTEEIGWSADGARLAWTREQVGPQYRFSDVRAGRPNGSRRHTLARFTDPSNYVELHNLRWSADGKRLLVEAILHEGD